MSKIIYPNDWWLWNDLVYLTYKKAYKAMKHQSDSKTTTLYIKNMVCPRCIRVVREELQGLGLDVRSVQLGEVIVAGTDETTKYVQLKEILELNGFELIEDRRVKIIEKIKHAVLKFVQMNNEEKPMTMKQSEFLAKEVGFEYHYLSTLFSSVENITIEQYIILQKIERVKELLKYGELTLSEISYKSGYSSVQHLSNQFKSVTGMTPTQFRAMTTNTRKPIDNVK